MTPDAAMRLALRQARRALGKTFPNPAVGAVVYRGAVVLGRGATQPPGGPHAEAVAIAKAIARHGKSRVRGATLAVTLEPCCFTGRTPPCTNAIIDAGIRKVYVGCKDPHARVNGRGVRALRRNDIEVVVGVREDDCLYQHRGFFSLCQKGRPFVTLKLATSLDGRIATATGESRWITGAASRKWVHDARSRSDAVMLGSGTALADDPELSARSGSRVIHRPVRVLVDSRLRVPASAKLFKGLASGRASGRNGFETWVLCRPRSKGRAAIVKTGAQLIDVPGAGRHLNLATAMRSLGKLGLTNLFVEGGGELAAAMLRAKVVDEIHWIQAPTLIGGDGRPALGPLSLERLRDAISLEHITVRRRGNDVHITASVGNSKRR